MLLIFFFSVYMKKNTQTSVFERLYLRTGRAGILPAPIKMRRGIWGGQEAGTGRAGILPAYINIWGGQDAGTGRAGILPAYINIWGRAGCPPSQSFGKIILNSKNS